MKKGYNWWTDPKNKAEVDRLSWWEHDENKTSFKFPISVIKEDGEWIASSNADSTELLNLHGVGQGKTKKEAIEQLFKSMNLHVDFLDEKYRSYQRFVPFRKGKWDGPATHWFVVFGIHFYFRRGQGMVGGKYVPFTDLNISVHNEWRTYRKWKQERKEL